MVLTFLGLFLILPIFSLILIGFTGEPVSVVSYCTDLNLLGFIHWLKKHATLDFYREFWATRRYRQGLCNAVGLAPLVALTLFILSRPLAYFLKKQKLLRSSALSSFLGLPLMMTGATLTILWSVLWPFVTPNSSLGQALIPGQTWTTRLLQSLGYCPLVTLGATALGTAIAFCLHRTSMPGRQLFQVASVVPLAVPPFLGALAYKNLLGPFGIITRALDVLGLSQPLPTQGPLAAGIVQAFLFFPFAVLTTSAALERSDPTLEEATQVMGAPRTFSLLTVTLPMLMPGIASGAFLIFIRSFGDFATMKLLIPTGYPMIVVEAYRDLSGSAYWGGAAMLSTLMILVILALLAVQKFITEQGGYETITGKSGYSRRGQSSLITDFVALLFCCGVFCIPVTFLCATILVSLAKNWGTQALPPAYTTHRYQEIFAQLFSSTDSPLFNSFALVLPALLWTVILSFIVSTFIARSHRKLGQILDFTTMLPFVVPGVAFAVALIGAFNDPPLALHFTAALVVIAYILTRTPYGLRATVASFQQIGTAMEESSQTLGATSWLTMCKVTVPLVLPGVIAGAIMVFISAMQDVAITLMISPPDWYPASVYVFHEIEQGNIFSASAYGIILLLIIMIPYTIAYRLGAIKASL